MLLKAILDINTTEIETVETLFNYGLITIEEKQDVYDGKRTIKIGLSVQDMMILHPNSDYLLYINNITDSSITLTDAKDSNLIFDSIYIPIRTIKAILKLKD